MKVTEQQVERAAEAMFLSENPLAASGDWDSQQRAVYEGLARAAIAALGDVEPEPLREISVRCEACGGQWYWPLDDRQELTLTTCHEHSDPPEPLEDVLLGSLVDSDFPGRDIRIGHSDGEWHVSQEHCGLEECWPTGVVGTGLTFDAAICAAVANATKGGEG